MYSQDIIELYQNGVQIVFIVFNSTDMNNKNHDHKKKSILLENISFHSAIAHVTIDAHVQNGRPRSTGTLLFVLQSSNRGMKDI